MPVFAALVKALWGNAVALLLALKAKELAVRLSAVGLLAAGYVAAVVAWSTYVSPLLGSLFATGYGQVLGLAFPPISGTVLTGLVGLWGVVVAKNYYQRFTLAALGSR